MKWIETEIKLKDLREYEKNPRRISKEQLQRLVKSITEDGYRNRIVVDTDNVGLKYIDGLANKCYITPLYINNGDDMGKYEDITGKKFGFLTSLEYLGNNKCLFLCDCGSKKIIKKSDVKRGVIKSCGCYNQKVRTSHNMSYSRTYNVWLGMKYRCYNPNVANYYLYGGKGVKVCDRWLNSFEYFLEDMGEKPDGFSIDRIDFNGNYEPSNCRWADQKTQVRNRRNMKIYEYGGESAPLVWWCEKFNKKHTKIYKRINELGYSFEKAMELIT